MASLPKLLNSIGIKSHMYADETQFWVSLGDNDELNNEGTARRRIVQAFSIISNFMKSSNPKLNPSKTQFIPFSRKTNPSSFSPLQLDDQVYVSPATEVRNLGVLMDSKLNFHSEVSEMRRNCFHQLKRLNSIHRFVPRDQFAILIHAFITSRIDFCNSIFYSLPENLVSRVQTI